MCTFSTLGLRFSCVVAACMLMCPLLRRFSRQGPGRCVRLHYNFSELARVANILHTGSGPSRISFVVNTVVRLNKDSKIEDFFFEFLVKL